MLVRAIERAGRVDALAIARALEGMRFGPAQGNPLGEVVMRAEDHQLLGPLYVSAMERAGAAGVARDVEGSGFGFRTERFVDASRTAPPHGCAMVRPQR
jgi:branched-chain amino acid transport system substrate-binding protein